MGDLIFIVSAVCDTAQVPRKVLARFKAGNVLPHVGKREGELTVGCSGDIQPTVGIAVGLFAANDGDPLATIKAAANIGGDTDTFACIAGMIAGAYRGFHVLPADWYVQFKEANPMLDFEWAAKELTEIAQIRAKK